MIDSQCLRVSDQKDTSVTEVLSDKYANQLVRIRKPGFLVTVRLIVSVASHEPFSDAPSQKKRPRHQGGAGAKCS